MTGRCHATRAWPDELLRCSRRIGHRGKHRAEGRFLLFEWGRMTKKEILAAKKAGGGGTQVLRITMKGARQ